MVQNDVAKRSLALIESGFRCAESVLLAVSEQEGIESELIPRIATGFCSGMARTRGQCGALSGAILSLSLMTGRNTADASVDAVYAKVRAIRSMFREKFGATDCGELLGLDIGTEEGLTAFYENNLTEQCLGYTEEAARMTMVLLEEGEAA